MFGFRKKSFDQLISGMPFDEIRKRARILVIDDDEEAFPCKLLEREGYNVHYWDKVKSLRELENGEYDLIVLDIFGVASSEISPNDGLGVLEHLKKHNPAQLVIAYSGQKYDLSQQSFWTLADDYLGKPSSLIECKQKIDSLLKKNFTPQHYWNTVENILKKEGVTDKKIRSFQKDVLKSLGKKPQPDSDKISKSLSVAQNTASIVWILVQIIGKFA